MGLISYLKGMRGGTDIPKTIRTAVKALPDEHIAVKVLADKILEDIPGVAVTVQDPQTMRYIRANSQACEWLGSSELRVLDRTVFEVVRDETSAALIDAADREAIRIGQHDLESWCILNDGLKRRLRSNRFLFKDKYGNHEYLVNLTQDVTAYHAATMRAEDLERTTRSLLTGLPFPIVWLDRRQKIKGSNPSFNAFTGVELPVHMTLLDIFPFAVAESFRTVCRLAETTNRPMSQQISTWSIGDESHREMVVHVCPMHDTYSQVVGTCAAMYDVTDLVRSTRIDSQLSRAFDLSTDAVILTNRHNAITYVNPEFCRLYGYTKEELVGRKPNVLQSGKHDAAYFANLWDTIKSGQTWSETMIDKSKDGKFIICPTTIVPVMNGDKEPIAYLCMKHTEGRTNESAT